MTSTPSASSALSQLLALGIPKVKAIYALKEFDNNAEIAADWCFTVRFPFILSPFHLISELTLLHPAFDSLTAAQEGASWTPNDLLQTTFTPPSSESFDHSPSSLSTPAFSRNSRTNDRHTPPGWQSVPARLLIPGTPVLITLKQDQGTDRTVQGVVGEKLTRGDHPRGVKVRLRDGRVGRVVRILSGEEAGNTGRTG